MNSFEEIARLKNLVAEKVKVIGVMEKERTAMHKLHKQYQKERFDQDSIEADYGERMRRVNEELRVAKGAPAPRACCLDGGCLSCCCLFCCCL